MSFSAVIATSASPSRRGRLLEIIQHICKDDLLEEVIVIWQSIEIPGPEFNHPKLKIFLCRARAVSLARNLGAHQTSGQWIWFLDDDTIPASNAYLETARYALLGGNDRRPLDFVTSNVCGEGAGQVCRRISADVPIDKKTIAGNFWEPGLIIDRKIFLQVRYDICLGPGCLHGSSEGTDFGLRLLAQGFQGMRVQAMELDHPRIEKASDSRSKIFFYSLGNGYVAIRHGRWLGYVNAILKSLVKLVYSLIVLRSSDGIDHLVRLCGLIAGPCLKPNPPINLEPSLINSPNIISEFCHLDAR
jgi:hypothetical protein